MFFLSPLPPLTRVCLLGVAPNASEAPHWKSALSLARKNLTHFFFFTISWLHIYGVYIPRNIFHKKRNGSPTTRHALFGRFSHKKRPVMAEMWHSDNKACLNGGGFPPFREACQVTNVVFQRYWLNKISLAKEPSQPENLFFSDEKKKKTCFPLSGARVTWTFSAATLLPATYIARRRAALCAFFNTSPITDWSVSSVKRSEGCPSGCGMRDSTNSGTPFSSDLLT